jgi:hypothetical protein
MNSKYLPVKIDPGKAILFALRFFTTKQAIANDLRAVAATFCLMLVSLSGFATIVPGDTITTNTTWTKSGSPYIITGTVIFEENTTLLVEPGTVIHFDSACYIRIYGKLKMQGTVTDSIFVTSIKPNLTIVDITHGFASGIELFGGTNTVDTTHIEYCNFSRASTALTNYGAILNIKKSSFKGCWRGIGSGSPMQVDSCLFSENRYGMTLGHSETRIIRSVFENNTSFGIWALMGSGTYCADNIFNKNLTAVVRCDYVINNIFTNNGTAIETCHFVHYNQIWNNNIGIEYWVDSATHNSILYNITGIKTYYNPNFGKLPTIKYNCIAFNKEYDMDNLGPDINLSNNYWGVTDSAQIESGVYDIADMAPSRGKVIFMPFLPTYHSACDTMGLPTNIKTATPKSLTLAIYPNPVSSSFTINAGTKAMQEVFIYNLTGSLVFHTTTGKNELNIDASSFNKGIYIYKVLLADNTIFTGKLIKE